MPIRRTPKTPHYDPWVKMEHLRALFGAWWLRTIEHQSGIKPRAWTTWLYGQRIPRAVTRDYILAHYPDWLADIDRQTEEQIQAIRAYAEERKAMAEAFRRHFAQKDMETPRRKVKPKHSDEWISQQRKAAFWSKPAMVAHKVPKKTR
jgi:hypothetical protein